MHTKKSSIMLEYKNIESNSRQDLDLVNKMVKQGWRLITIVPSTVPNCQSLIYWFERETNKKTITTIKQNTGNVYIS